MGPLLVAKVFSEELFRLRVERTGDCRLSMSLEYVDAGGLRQALDRYGLRDDSGLFFYNCALHIQGTARLGWDTFARDGGRKVHMGPAIQELTDADRKRLVDTCRYEWEVEWAPDVRLRRLREPEDILSRTVAVYEALQRKDLEYYLQRIQSLEVRIQTLAEGDRFHELVGRSRRMHQLYQLIEQVAGSDLTVMVRGESGTGKELVARAIHQSSPRAEHPFVPVNCAAFTESLLESELFGHEKGAFTGADHAKPGRFELAQGGTLFLDEVGDIPVTTQVKLLRSLETRTFERVGGTESIAVDVRIVAATNRDLEELISTGQFREDLYFRLNVVPVNLPPLREHAEDIPQLAHSFLQQLAERSGVAAKGLARGAIDRLIGYSWPGNIRELRNVIERAAVVYSGDSVLREGDVVRALGVQGSPAAGADLNVRQRRLLLCIDDAGTASIDHLLATLSTDGDSGGTSRRTLQNDLRRLTDLGYTRWQKSGTTRLYVLTPEGRAELDG
jgi:transcriptional regulator with GAF, ATPase, and Fis domain